MLEKMERESKGTRALPDDLKEVVKGAFEAIEPEHAKLGLTASKATVKKILGLIASDGCTYEKMGKLAAELNGRLIDELSEPRFFSLNGSEVEHYLNPRSGWEKIIERFDGVVDDVVESRKCFAVSRYPAAVFHSVQIVEFGLIELGRFLKVKDPHSGWTAIAKTLEDLVNKNYRKRTKFERQNYAFLEQLQGTVKVLKDAWRNKISHVQGRLEVMTTDFSAEVAEEILMATRGFMRRLAEGLPPKAN